MVIISLAFLAIFIILFMQFKTLTASCIHFSGVFIAFAGGFMMIWLYGQSWFFTGKGSDIMVPMAIPAFGDADSEHYDVYGARVAVRVEGEGGEGLGDWQNFIYSI
jgi:Cu/Ag efflux pump CusA